MRTTLDRRDDVVDALMARHPELSKTEAIELWPYARISARAPPTASGRSPGTSRSKTSPPHCAASTATRERPCRHRRMGVLPANRNRRPSRGTRQPPRRQPDPHVRPSRRRAPRRHPSQRRPELCTLLAGLGWADLGREQWHEIGETAARLRELGQTVPLTDVAIAVAASASNSELWTHDSGFDRIEQVLTPPRPIHTLTPRGRCRCRDSPAQQAHGGAAPQDCGALFEADGGPCAARGLG
jgi:hypothetical protein